MVDRNDYDSPWKEAISLYFRAFMAFFFADIERNIDWSRGYEFLDKELQQIVGDAAIGRRDADKLVKVWRGDGVEIWVLIHIEVQSQAREDFAERMYVYNNRIFDRYRRPVVSLAILADDRPDWRPNEYRSELWGCRVSLEFPAVKLLDYQTGGDILSESRNPFAVIVSAHLTTLQTKRNPRERYQSKVRIVKDLYQRGYSRKDIRSLLRLIDWIVRLPKEIESEFTQEISRFEEERRMPYISSFERLARKEGILLNARESVIEALTIRFAEVPNSIVETINSIENRNLLKTLHRQAITAGSIDEFQNYLPRSNDNGER